MRQWRQWMLAGAGMVLSAGPLCAQETPRQVQPTSGVVIMETPETVPGKSPQSLDTSHTPGSIWASQAPGAAPGAAPGSDVARATTQPTVMNSPNFLSTPPSVSIKVGTTRDSAFADPGHATITPPSGSCAAGSCGSPGPGWTGAACSTRGCAPGVDQSFWGRLQDCFIGYPSEFQSPPLGYYVYYYGRTQVANGDASRMVLYQYDFVPGTDQLSPRGKRQLAKIGAMLPKTFSPLLIETSQGLARLDEARRTAVMNEVLGLGFPIPPERVVIGFPTELGTTGAEAELVYRNFLTGITTGGRSVGAGIGPVGAALGLGGAPGSSTPPAAGGGAPSSPTP